MKKKIKYILFIAMTFLLLCHCPTAEAFQFFRKKTTKEKINPQKKTPYLKFLEKKNLKSANGLITIYKDNKDIWLEIPDSLIGRRVIICNQIIGSSSPWTSLREDVSEQKIYKICKKDTTLIFREPQRNVETDDPSIKRALSKSRIDEDAYLLPTVYRNSDSTAIIIKATKIFSPSNKSLFDLNGIYVSEGKTIETAIPIDELSFTKDVKAFPSGVGIIQEVSYDVTLAQSVGYLKFMTNEKKRFSGTFISALCVLPEDTLKPRIADPRIGVITEPFTSYRTERAVKKEKNALRWNLNSNRTIDVYVDTLFSPTWREAIKKGICTWNEAFERIGLGERIRVINFTKDLNSYDPFISKIVASKSSNSENISASICGNSLSGGIISSTISVPGGFADGLRKRAMLEIADVDTRFQNIQIPDDAICEVLSSEMMKIFGQVLGLERNYAGSYAYSPTQLRDPSFTKEKGITASVTDDVTFNIFAIPGDKEQGLTIISNKIGEYDKYAIEWLYKEFPEGADEKALLNDFVEKRQGQKEYLYIPYNRFNPDPRCLRGDLGNNLFAFHKAALNHLKTSANEATEWLPSDKLDGNSYKELFLDFLWLRFRSVNMLLAKNIGGVYINDRKDTKTYIPIPKSIQKKALNIIMDSCSDLSWIDKNKELMQYSGAYYSIQSFNTIQMSALGIYSRSENIIFAENEAESQYTWSEFIDDYIERLTKNISRGLMLPGEEMPINNLIYKLTESSPVLTENYRLARAKKNFALQQDISLRPNVIAAPEVWKQDLDAASLQKLKKLRNILSKGKSMAKDSFSSGKISFLISEIDSALKGKGL